MAGHTDSKWDSFATSALTEFARVRANVCDENEPTGIIIATNASAAVDAGCDDPLVNYLFIRFAFPQTNSPQAFSEAFCKVALDLQRSSYPSVRKFYAAAAAVDQLFFTYGTNTAAQSITHEVRPLLRENLTPAFEDKTMPAGEAYDLAKRAMYLVSGDRHNYEQSYHFIEPLIFNNWPDDSLSWLFKGDAYIQMAWMARGVVMRQTSLMQAGKHFFRP